MRKCFLILLGFLIFSSVIASSEKDMKYHAEPSYYLSPYGKDAFACYFKLSDFGITGYDYKIKIIGFIGYEEDGPADIYVTSKEVWDQGQRCYVPACNPDNNWDGSEYGPKEWHINNLYPNYDDCDIYNDNWHYSKDVDKFWCIYYLKTGGCPPYPVEDDYVEFKNSLTYWSSYKAWIKGVYGTYGDWCMHCVIVYWGVGVENTSLGLVKTLFR
jgi:hypothetical protein